MFLYAVLGKGRYNRFDAFLQERGLVKKLPKMESYAVKLSDPRQSLCLTAVRR
jgi:hypothetical protein